MEAKKATDKALYQVELLEALLQRARTSARSKQKHYEELVRNEEFGQLELPWEDST